MHSLYERRNNEKPKYLPWVLLPIIRLAYDYCGSPDIIIKDITEEEFIDLYNNVHKIQSYAIEKQDNFNKDITILAHQQFWATYSERELLPSLGRQILLFSKFDKEFKNHTGISVERFCQLTFGIWPNICVDKKQVINETYFDNIKNSYPEDEIDSYFQLARKIHQVEQERVGIVYIFFIIQSVNKILYRGLCHDRLYNKIIFSAL